MKKPTQKQLLVTGVFGMMATGSTALLVKNPKVKKVAVIGFGISIISTLAGMLMPMDK